MQPKRERTIYKVVNANICIYDDAFGHMYTPGIGRGTCEVPGPIGIHIASSIINVNKSQKLIQVSRTHLMTQRQTVAWFMNTVSSALSSFCEISRKIIDSQPNTGSRSHNLGNLELENGHIFKLISEENVSFYYFLGKCRALKSGGN